MTADPLVGHKSAHACCFLLLSTYLATAQNADQLPSHLSKEVRNMDSPAQPTALPSVRQSSLGTLHPRSPCTSEQIPAALRRAHSRFDTRKVPFSLFAASMRESNVPLLLACLPNHCCYWSGCFPIFYSSASIIRLT